jgi:membrane-associated phospholipid phosphatase
VTSRAVIRAGDTLLLRTLDADSPAVRGMAVALSEAARAGRCWLASSAVLALAGARYRRAGVDGLAAWAAAEVAAQTIKGFTHRRRPRVGGRRGHSPSSSSMPSAHTAAAVAYAVAAASAAPVIAMPVGALAGAVSWSRLSTGRHFPTDVAAAVGLGLVVGGTVAALERRAKRKLDDRRLVSARPV